MNASSSPPLRVAIIGGGCGGITAAYELSRPEHHGRFEVSLFQQGWRLGGKGASGRGPAGRIEEHGLHVWLGHYDNAFAMMRDCYDKLEISAPGCFGDWRDAFLPEAEVGLFAPTDRAGWQDWHGQFPIRPGLPGDPGQPGKPPPRLSDYLDGMAAMLRTLVLDVDVRRDDAVTNGDGDLPEDEPSIEDAVAAISALLARGAIVGGFLLAEALLVLRISIAALPPALDGLVLRLADRVADGLRRWIEDHLIADDRQRHLWEVMDVTVASMVGIVRGGLLRDPRGLDAIDDWDIRDWLVANGASPLAANSAYVRGLYDLSFAYQDGDADRPRFAAGTGLRGAMRLFFGYRGALFWRLRSGMGDIVFAPLYTLLKERGVRFAFFHRLANVGLGAAGTLGRSHVASLDFTVQAKTLDNAGYNPLIEVAGRPCWPSEPRYDQLANGQSLVGHDLESFWDKSRAGRRRLVVGKDFDFVVIATGIGTLPHVAAELIERNRRWRRMVDGIGTVATQAFQIWLDRDVDSLGRSERAGISTGFSKPFDTWSDMAQTIPDEGWEAFGKEPPATALYFCSVLPEPPGQWLDDPGYPSRRANDVFNSAVAFLDGPARTMFPRSGDGGFAWESLVDPLGRELFGRERFTSQYWRANVNPSDRYTLSLPGTTALRISPLDMAFDNLTIAGDWTQCGLNAGCTEAAVISGRLAAHALSGLPALADIPGFDHP